MLDKVHNFKHVFNTLSLQASTFVLNEALVDEVDYEHSDDDDQEDEEERARQLAESVPLRPLDYVDPVQAIAARWLAQETSKLQLSPMQPTNTTTPSASSSHPTSTTPVIPSINNSASPHPHTASLSPLAEPPSASQINEAARTEPTPLSAPLPSSSVVPRAVFDFLDSTDAGHSDSPTVQAWKLLNEYMTGLILGEHVKVTLEKLHVGEEWDAMRVRIMQVEPGDDTAEEELRALLDAMRPAQEPVKQLIRMDLDFGGPGDSVPDLDAPILDSDLEEDSDPDVLNGEQLELCQFIRAVLGQTNELEDVEVFHVRCHVNIFLSALDSY